MIKAVLSGSRLGLLALAGLLLAAPVLAQNGPAEAPPAAAPEPTPPKDPYLEALNEGWEQFRFADFGKSARAFERALQSDKPEIRAEATYGLGYLWQYRPVDADPERAMGLYREVLSNYAATGSAPWAMLAIARGYDLPRLESQRNVSAARDQYLEIMKLYPQHMVASEAALRLACTYLEKFGDAKAQQEGIAILNSWIEQHPDNFLAPGMYLLIGKTHVANDRWAEAVAAYRKAEELDHERSQVVDAAGKPAADPNRRTLSPNKLSEMYYQAARISEEKLKDDQMALYWYRKIVAELSRDNKIYFARQQIQRLEARKAARPDGNAAPEAPQDPDGPGGDL